MELFTSDTQAAQELKGGNMDALGYFYQLYHHQLYQFLHTYCRDHDLAEEMVQCSFVKAWEKRHQVDTAKSAKNWIYTIAKNLLIDSLRQTKYQEKVWNNRKAASEEDYSTLDQIVYADYQRVVSSVLLKLPARNQEVFDLSRSQQLSNKEIATLLNISVKSVEKHLTKTLRFLRGFLKDQQLLILFIILNLY